METTRNCIRQFWIFINQAGHREARTEIREDRPTFKLLPTQNLHRPERYDILHML